MTLKLPPTETPDGAAQNRGYEARDLTRKSIPIAIVSIVVGAIVVHFVTFRFYRLVQHRPMATETPGSAVAPDAVPTNRNLPPVEKEDVRLLREHENKVFQKLGWQAQGDLPDVKIPDAVIEAVKERK